jgi:SAM-dependent methyltransferase
LVYNPLNENLPPQAERLENDYKQILKARYGIDFNHLLTITNVPIARFKDSLESRVKYGFYIGLLRENFNFAVVDNLMCRAFLSAGFDGKLYDCDFNLALGWALKDEFGNSLSLDTISPAELEGKEIALGEHCFACTAGYGSSCQGALHSPQSTVQSPEGRGSKYSSVREYYGKVLKSKSDLKTNACCLTDSLPKDLRKIISLIEPEIKDKFYGCGSPIPPALEGCRILDLGCGTGRDVYVASYLAGKRGFVIGVDMTDEQLEIAQKHSQRQMEKFGFSKRNVEFKKGYIENLKKLGIEDNSIDLVISNCVINLSPDKESVFREILRVLKPGGELYFSDVFSGRRIPEHLKSDPVLYGECLAGALYIEDFRRLLRELGCLDYRVVSKKKISLDQPEMEKKAGMIDFYSMTVRAFKLDTLEDICEDYGQAAMYLGTIPELPHQFILDDHHIFKTNKPMLVCGNTASMLQETRYGRHFKLSGDRSIHYGPFGCLSTDDQAKENSSSKGACC